MQNNGFPANKTWNVGGRLVDFSIAKVMGILNITPDSFFDGGRHSDVSDALRQTEKMISEGADFVDVGGYSSRPGAEDIPEDEEIRRVVPVIESIRQRFPDLLISIDTFRSSVAQHAINAGAMVINDITGGDHDKRILTIARQNHTPYIAMHMRGNPKTMTQLTNYDNVVNDVIAELQKKVHQCTSLGLNDVAVDPGFGFAKTVDQNFELLANLDSLRIIGQPVLVGLSRKSMIWRTLQITPEEALNGTSALHMAALLKGADILRVHDVKEAVQCVKLHSKLKA